jgi:putative transposase
MKSPKRKLLKHYNIPGHVHFLTFTCFKGLPLFEEKQLCLIFQEALEKACQKHSIEPLAYVIMPEHVHLVAHPQNEKYDIGKFLQMLKRMASFHSHEWMKSTNYHLLAHLSQEKGSFHFWQEGGGFDKNINGTKALQAIIDYVHNNPVRKRLCEKPTDWPWSSASWYEG